MSSSAPRHIADRRDLRHAHAGNNARGADRAGTDTDLDRRLLRGPPRPWQRPPWQYCRRSPGYRGKRFFTQLNRSSTLCECPCAVSTTMHIHAGFNQGLGALLGCLRRRPSLRPPATARVHPCMALGCSEVLTMSLTVIRPRNSNSLVDHQHALQPVLMQQRASLLRGRCLHLP